MFKYSYYFPQDKQLPQNNCLFYSSSYHEKDTNILALLLLIILLGCTTEKKKLSAVDTTLILDKAFNNEEINKSLPNYLSNQPLRIVRSSFLKDDYKFYKNGMSVVYVDVDSSSTKLTDWRQPKLYANISDFKITSDEKVKIALIFRGSGRYFEISLVKKNGDWIVSKFEDSDI